jgi:hypothetical protein
MAPDDIDLLSGPRNRAQPVKSAPTTTDSGDFRDLPPPEAVTSAC